MTNIRERIPNIPDGALETDANFDFKAAYFRLKDLLTKAQAKIGRQRNNLKHCGTKIAALNNSLSGAYIKMNSLKTELNDTPEFETQTQKALNA